MSKCVAVIGAGPIGLEAALQALDRGHRVTLFERGPVGAATRDWGHVRMFSPFVMNVSALGRKCLDHPPADDAFLTGAEFVAQCLEPIAAALGDCLQTGAAVRSLGRRAALKGDWIGDPERARRPFQLLVEQGGRERIEEADIVLDCSGTYGQPNGLGAPGMPVPGERSCADSIFYGVPDLAGAARPALAGRRVLVIGAGHSAATTINALARLAESDRDLQVDWIIRKSAGPPAAEIPGDPLPARRALAQTVNRLAATAPWLQLRAGQAVRALHRNGRGIEVQLEPGAGPLSVDAIVACTGFRPDVSLARELQVSLCYATEGTLPLAAQLLGETGGDCLARGSHGVDTLRHPEPGYFALGMKSYGRSSEFLIRTGYDQVTAVMDSLEDSR